MFKSAVFLAILLPWAAAHGSHHHHHHQHHAHDLDEHQPAEQQRQRDLRHGFGCSVRPSHPLEEKTFEQMVKKHYPGEGSLGERRLKKSKSKSAESFQQTVMVYHWLYSDTTAEYISLAQVEAQMNWLNAAFEGTGFEFETEMVARVPNSEIFNTYDGLTGGNAATIDNEIRAMRKGCYDTLNVFWMNLRASANPDEQDYGYAAAPGFFNDFSLDAVNIHYEAITGGALARFNEGDILVHEVGHWLSLLHVNQVNDGTDNRDCFESDDKVEDTPVQLYEGGPADGMCPTAPVNSCPQFPGFDTPDNYMSLYDNTCMNTFTPGQIERMQMGWEIYRTQGGESIECAVSIEENDESGKSGKNGKNGKSGKNGNGKSGKNGGTRRLRKSKVRGLRKLERQKGRKYGFRDLTTHAYSELVGNDVPTCDGVVPYLNVAWVVVEGTGEVLTFDTVSPNLYTSVTVVTGSRDAPTCVAAAKSESPAATGDVSVTFLSIENQVYYVATTTGPYPGTIGVGVDAPDGSDEGAEDDSDAAPLPAPAPGVDIEGPKPSPAFNPVMSFFYGPVP